MRFFHHPSGLRLLHEDDAQWFLRQWRRKNPGQESYFTETVDDKIRIIQLDEVGDKFIESFVPRRREWP